MNKANKIVKDIFLGLLKDSDDAILRAAFVFEAYRLGPREGFGWDDDIKAVANGGSSGHHFTLEHCRKLRIGLTGVINRKPQHRLLSRAAVTSVWALSKLRDKSLIPFLTDVLANQAYWASSALAQSMMALVDSGIDPYEGFKDRPTEFGPDQVLNLQLAANYLERAGYKSPLKGGKNGVWWAGLGELQVKAPLGKPATKCQKK